MDQHSSDKPAIILVDDEPQLVHVLKHFLRELVEAYDLIAVSSAPEVLAHLTTRSVPLVVTDYHLQGMDGVELAAVVKERSPGTSVMLMTAYDTSDVEQQARQHGVDYYLPKPFPLGLFMQMVRDILDHGTPKQPQPDVWELSDASLDTAHRLYHLARQRYRTAGMPYGASYDGLLRWVTERLVARI